MRNERTSKRVAKIAGVILRQVPKNGLITISFVHPKYGDALVQPSNVKWEDIRALAASALTQTADKEKRYHPDVPQPVMDDVGFDPRDGGKIGRQHVPKRGLVKAMRKALSTKPMRKK